MSSPFASHTQTTIALPFDPPHTVTIRKLTGREVERAQVLHREGVVFGETRGWAAIFKRSLVAGANDPDVKKAIADPLTGYDRFAIVRAGLVAWTYPHAMRAAAPGPEPKTDAVEDLDDEAVDFIATEILRLTKPALFSGAEALDQEKKTG